jgi:hypothetical protein
MALSHQQILCFLIKYFLYEYDNLRRLGRTNKTHDFSATSNSAFAFSYMLMEITK